MNPSFRLAALVSLLPFSTMTTRAVTVFWDGGGGNNSWHTAANWSGDVLPGPADDVVIDVPGEITVVHSSNSTTVRSLRSQEGFQLSGGFLSLTAGNSFVNGPLRMSDGGLEIRGATTVFAAGGSVTNTGANLTARSGGRISLPTLQRLVRSINGDVIITADGTNSVVDLPAVTVAGAEAFYQVVFLAYDGGRVSAPQFSQLLGGIEALSDGPNSLVDLSGFQGPMRRTLDGFAYLEVYEGASILIPGVTALDRVDLYIHGDGQIHTAQLTALTGAGIELDGVTNHFPALTNIMGTHVTLYGGARAAMAGVTQLGRTNSGSVGMTVTGTGSVLEFPNVTNAAVEPFYRLQLYADDGGRLALPRFTTILGGIDVNANGAGSVVDLPGLKGRLANTKSGSAYIEALNSGVVLITNVTALERIDVTLRNSGTITLSQLTSFNDARFTFIQATNSYPALTNALGANFTVGTQAKLTLPNITWLGRTNSGDVLLVATERGILEFPNLVAARALDFYQLQVDAKSGSRILLPKFAVMDGALIVQADGADTLVGLPGLTGRLANATPGLALFEVRNGATIQIPNLTALDRVNISISGTGQINTLQLTEITYGSLTLDNAVGNFPALTQIDGSSLAALNGANLTLPGVSQIVRSNGGSVNFTADESGSVLALPNLTSALVQPFYQLELFAKDGGRVLVPELASMTGALDVLAGGTGSFVDLSGLHGTLGGTQPGSTFLEVGAGGTVLIPNVTSLDDVILTIQDTGTVSTEQLTAVTRSDVTVDGTTAVFANVTDTTGSTFEYLNGGGALFQPPADLQVTAIHAPASVVAGEPFSFWWEVRNNGTGVTNGTWKDGVHLSPDAVPGNDQFIGLLANGGTILAGAARRQTNIIALGAHRAGTWHVAMVANQTRTIFEGTNLFNNTNVSAATIQVQAPDLVVEALTLQTNSTKFGQPLSISWRVRNDGTAPASVPWNDRLVLARTSNQLSDAVTLLNRPTSEVLAPGAAYTRTETVPLPIVPQFTAGNFAVVVLVDSGNALAESIETNNTFATALALSLPPLPDLVSARVVSPTNGLPGETVSVVWAVTNQGAAAVNGAWTETLSVASTNTNAPRQWLGSFTFTNQLAIGAGLLRTQQVTIPDLLKAGGARLRVDLDTEQTVAEQNEGNNSTIALQVLNIPAKLTLQIPSNRIAEDAAPPEISALVMRNGDTTAALTVTLSSSDVSELTVPPTVVINAGESSASFKSTAHQDGIYDADATVNLTATAVAYQPATTTVTVENTDAPRLQLSVAGPVVVEGATVGATVSHGAGTNNPVVVSFAGIGTRQLLLPEMAVIPAGQTSVVITVLALDDTYIEAARFASFEATAPGFFSASAGMSITDNDLPEFVLTLAASSVSEGAGTEAATATISRGVASPRSLAVELENDNPLAALVPASVTIPAGQTSFSFPVAAVNDSAVDGTQAAQIRAVALASVTGQRLAASAPVLLIVTDDDGPTLTITSARDAVAEGLTNATTLTITRNSGVAQALQVNLTSSLPAEATVPALVTIPAGQTNVTVPLVSINDNVVDGSKPVQITVAASGFTPASVTILVTDVNRPDLVVTEVTVPQTAETEAFINVAYRVANHGLSSAGTNWVTRVFLSDDPVVGDDTLLADYEFNGTLPVGQTYGQSRQVRLPLVAGNYWVVVVTDLANQIDEVLESNNTGVSARPIQVIPGYHATVATDVSTAPAGATVPLHGTATRSSTGGPAAFALVNIHLNVRGTKRIISAITDDAGQFSATFNPLPGEAGLYEIGAAHPGLANAPIQDSFTLFGMRAEKLDPLKLTEQRSVAGQLEIENLGDLPLNGLTATVVSNLANLEVTATVATNLLAGRGKALMGFGIAARDASVSQGTIVIRLTSAEGAQLNIPIDVTVKPLQPRLVTNPSELVAGMKVGGQAFVEFEVVNQGGATSAPVHIILPNLPWMHVATANPLPPLAPGATNRVTLQLRPTANLTLGAYEGNLAVNAGNLGVSLPYSFRALSEAKGDLVINAVDEYTYFAEGSPRVAGAAVTIRDAVSLEVVTNGVTDANGQYSLNGLQEGYYQIELTADKHTKYREIHLVVAGKRNDVLAFLRREAVRYIWTVVPTEIEDRTRITIETVFEAFVPMPVVTVDPPLIDLSEYTADVTQIDLKVSNHGLIAAKEAKLSFGTHPDWSFEPLIHDLGDIPARSSFTIPLLIRRTRASVGANPPHFAAASFAPAALGSGCTVAGNCRFVIQCGDSKLGGSADIPVINASASGNCGGGGGGVPDGPGGTEGRGGAASGGSPAGSSTSIKSCDKCLLAIFSCLLDLALPDFASCLKDAAGCGSSLTNTSNSIGDDAYACMKTILNCAVAAGELLPVVGDTLDLAECVANISQDCGSPPDGGGGGGGTQPSLNGFTLAAAGGSGSSRVERAELAILRQRAAWIGKELAPLRYVIGNDAWFRDRSPTATGNWLAAFVARIESNTAAGRKISEAERAQLLAVPLPSTVTPVDAHTLIDRWNRSLDYWAAGILGVLQLPAGQSTNFIAIDVFRGLSQDTQMMFAESEAAGFAHPEDGLRQARADLIRFLSEGDGGGVCAHVRLQIEQQAVMTRDAFAATLEIQNDSLGELRNIGIQLSVRRRSGEDVTTLFAIRPPVLSGISAVDGTGVVSSNAVGKILWTLVPTTDAVLASPEEFLVGGLLTYRQDQLNITVPLAPSLITVYPSASLAVKYFHQRDVFADDPFTTEIEPSVPFSLAVMVENRGHGTARNVRIDSAQPRIVGNEKGLLADFKIIATEVAGRNLEPSLTVNFGRIDSGTNAIGRWLLTSTILGGFIDYTATFEHLDGLGDKKLSLIEGIEIHELIHAVRATGSIDDGRPDFLVNDVPDLYDRPDTLHLSDGSLAPVGVVQEGVFDRAPTSANLIVQLTAKVPAGWAYLRLPDPGTNRFRLARVVRSDGVELPFGDNAWTTDRTFLGNALRPLRENVLHLFDRDSTGRYTLYYSPLTGGDTNAPSSIIAQLPAESSALIPVSWSGTDNPGGRGLATFDVFVSIDGAPFIRWIWETIDRSAVFQGAVGKTYSFYSVGTDAAGNREEAPLTADAWTTVTRTNHAPKLEPIASRVLQEGDVLIVQPIATDADADQLVFSLEGATPIGAVIHPYTGLITWITGEGSGPSNYTFTVQALDNGAPRLGAVRTFTVTVSDDNLPPILNPIANSTINEGRFLSITNRATDHDLPAQVLTFRLEPGAPAGATIHPATGVFIWQPTEFQGGTTNRISVVVEDNGSPSMSATQSFRIVVRDTQSDFIVGLSTTNVLAGQSSVTRLDLTAGADLKRVDFELGAKDPHLVNLSLEPLSDEVTSISFEPGSAGYFHVRVELDPTRTQTGARTLAALGFDTQPTGHSSVAHVRMTELEAVRSGGELLPNGVAQDARIFIIENEPLLDVSPVLDSAMRLTLYGRPSARYRLQSSAALGAQWIDGAGVELDGTYHSTQEPMNSGQRLFRAVKE